MELILFCLVIVFVVFYQYKLIEKYEKALIDISQTCPVLFPTKGSKTHLFQESTVRRQKIAESALNLRK